MCALYILLGWVAKGEKSSIVFNEVDLTEEWCDYDENEVSFRGNC